MPTRDPSYRRVLAKLKAARRAAGLTQTEVASLLGKPQSFVAKCESGERRIDVVELARFVKLYRRPMSHFLADL